MPARAERLSRYGAAVEGLVSAYADLGPLAAADEDQAAVQGTRLDDAIDSYVSESRLLFAETVESDSRAALASLGGDFRVLAALGSAAQGPDLTADETGLGSFAADLELAVAGGTEPGPAPMAAAGGGDPVSGAVASINAISATGQAKLRTALTAAVLPNAAELGAVCAWLTEDHLDSCDLAWLPDRVRGVGAVLA